MQNAVINLLGVAIDHRPAFFKELLPALLKLRLQIGRPHWIVIDEAHHVLPAHPDAMAECVPREFGGLALVTLDPKRVAPAAFAALNVVCAVGEEPLSVLSSAAELFEMPPPRGPADSVGRGEALVWRRGKKRAHLVNVALGQTKRRRHRRSVARGEPR